MNLSEALIEKYHKGLCTPEERRTVEKWLETGETDEFELPAGISLGAIKQEIWNEIRPSVGMGRAIHRRRPGSLTGWAAAAALVTAVGLYSLVETFTPGISKHLPAGEITTRSQAEPLQIELGNESGAVYIKESRMLDFCGVVKIIPKENMKLSFTSLCDGNRETVKEMVVKGGTTYFAMDLRHHNSSELVVMDKNLVGELPPIVQNSLIAQFGI
ncbi:hypothetical protein GCM10023091_28130 [Ravibacter arvi]|uniref:FecR protein domain-containing protein n=1 Tax=Ravibacter arvi TaxID=2051041 RepID=A0ABP8M0L0_9BACT